MPLLSKEGGWAPRGLGSNFLSSVVGEGFGRVLFFVANVHLATALGPEYFGLLALAQAVAMSLWQFVDLGVAKFGMRELARRDGPPESVVGPLMGLRIVGGVVALTLYVMGVLVSGVPRSDWLTYAAVGLYLVTYVTYVDWIPKGLQRFDEAAAAAVILAVAFSLGVLLLVDGPEDTALAGLLWSGAYLLGGVILLARLVLVQGLRIRPELAPRVWSGQLRVTGFFFVSALLFAGLQNLPPVAVGMLFETEDVGQFAAAQRLVGVASAPGFLLATVFYPAVSALFQESVEAFRSLNRRLLTGLAAVGVLAALTGGLIAPNVIDLLYGVAYAESAGILRVLVWIVPLQFVRYGLGNAVLAAGGERAHFWAPLFGMAVFLASLTAADSLGVVAVAAGAVAAEATTVVAYAWLLSVILRDRGGANGP